MQLQSVGQQPVAPRTLGAQWVVVADGRRRGLVPSFYVPHEDPEKIVVKDYDQGVPLLAEVSKRPFTVAEVPYERRWAIHPDGTVLRPDQFRERFEKLYYETFEAIAAENPDARPSPGKPENRGIPHPIQYVSVQEDANEPWRMVPMHYDPTRTAGARPEQLFDSKGEEVDRMATLVAAHADPRTREKMRPDEIAEVEAHLGVSGVSGVAAQLAELNHKLVTREITPAEHSQRVAELVGAEPPKPKRGRPRKKPVMPARRGIATE